MDKLNPQKPCLVETPQGFSVSYKDKLLYSKYNPSRTILQTIQNLQLQPGTIILCCSPLLGYGIAELIEKLPEDCLILGCECDEELFNFSKDNFQLKNISDEKFIYLTPHSLPSLPSQILTTFQPYKYRRFLRIDFSAGTDLHSQFYEALQQACTQALMSYWTNRVTLVKFGRKYSHNFFENLKKLPFTTPVENYFQSVTKPIVLFGAGESIENGINLLKKDRACYYIICVDTALQPLLQNGIIPDACFIEEAQQVITKAFIGTTDTSCHFFAGLTSISRLSHNFNLKNLSYFTTAYTNAAFLDNLNKSGILPHINNPYGSVGLTAFYYATLFRASNEIPVYVYGLDFSYSAGKTHANGTMAHKRALLNSNRLKCIENYNAAFCEPAFLTDGANGKVYTTPLLKKYADLFIDQFVNNLQQGQTLPNIFNAAESGLELNLPHKNPEPESFSFSNKATCKKETENLSKKLEDYFKTEKDALNNLKDILTGKIKLEPVEQEKNITRICEVREYLFLHFPDGTHFSYTQDFLNRLRVELDYFLKIF